MKVLILAEKPSVAEEIAAALGVPQKGRIYENNEYIISNFIGHVTNIHANEFDVANATLPILPKRFNLLVSEDKKEQFNLIKRLMSRTDISCIYNACDADREGESIFMRVYTMLHCKLPIKRMWIMATTSEGYRKAFKEAKDGKNYLPLFFAAMSRAESDMIWGYNGSIALKMAFGRVQTPTLAMVCDAYERNKNFVSSDFFEIIGTFALKAGSFKAKLLDANGNFRRFETEKEANLVISAISGQQPSKIVDENKEELNKAPYLFDMNTLLRMAAKKYKYKAEKTTAILQDLYEKLGVITYPRSDYNALHEDEETQNSIFEKIRRFAQLDSFKRAVGLLEKHNLLVFNKNVFDESRTGSHYAIVPTGLIKIAGKGECSIDSLSEDVLKDVMTMEQWNVFHMIALRTMAAFCPPARYSVTTRKVYLADKVFRVTGKILKNMGWLALYGREEDGNKKKEMQLPDLGQGEKGETVTLEKHLGKTTPPPLLTEETLLRMMETAGRLIEDEELAQNIKDKGIGTSSTRTAIVTSLQKDSKSGRKAYVNETKKGLVPSSTGMALYLHLKHHYPRSLDPIITGEWEYFLKQVEEGKKNKDEFMSGIHEEVSKFCAVMSGSDRPKVPIEKEVLCGCPVCQKGELLERKLSFTCNHDDCGFTLWKEVSGKKLSKTILKKLCKNGVTDVIDGFTSKSGKHFSAAIKLVEHEAAAGGMKMAFEFSKSEGNTYGKVESYSLPCPCCSSEMFEKPKLLECSQKEDCGFKVWKMIAGHELTKDQIKDLITSGKTKEKLKFTKKDGINTFQAFLRLEISEKKVLFDFN